MRKKFHIITIMTIIFIILNIINMNISLALPTDSFSESMLEGGGGSGSSSSPTTINPDNYDPSNDRISTDEASALLDKVGVILGVVRNVSVIVAVIALMLIGFKYIIGSVEEKAKYKETMMPYIIGCIMAAAGTTLVTFIYNAFN